MSLPEASRSRTVMTLVALITCCAAVSAQDTVEYADFNELDLESLLDQTIVTASKHPQKLSDSPMSATVITADEIAASGARSIPELLRDVPGLDVIQATSSGFDTSARGLNKLASNAMLVLVDGRSVYVDIYGMTIWNQLSVSLEDIRTIEVILGPGSALHGANAYAGVINIITFAAGERPGTTIRSMATSLSEAYGSVRHSGRGGDHAWKVNTSWDRSSDWERDRHNAESVRLDAQVRREIGPDHWLALGAGHTNGQTEVMPSDTSLLTSGTSTYARAEYARDKLSVHCFLNAWDLDLRPESGNIMGAAIAATSYVHDLELRRAFTPRDDHHLLFGGSVRLKETRFEDTDADASETIWAGFILEEWNPSPQWCVSAGVRLEDSPLVGSHWSPRGGVVFKPSRRHALRASYSKAYRVPSYLESHWRQDVELIPGFPQVVRGCPDNDSEEIQSVELGYQGLLRDDLLVNAAVFYNEMDNLIAMRSMADYPSPPAPWPGIPMELAFVNANSWTARGGELSLQADPCGWLRLASQYSYVWLDHRGSESWESGAPKHHASVTAIVHPGRGHQLTLASRYRSAGDWPANAWSPDHDGTVDAIVVADLTWSVLLADGGHRATVAVKNLFDHRHRDHPLAIEQRQRVLASVTLNF